MKIQIKNLSAIKKLTVEKVKKLDTAIERGFWKWRTYLDVAIQKQLSNKALKRRTGVLAKSFLFQKIVKTGKSFYLTMISSQAYAKIHEYGGVITPKNSKYLTIPLPSAMTPAGVVKQPAREWGNTFVKTVKSGNKVIFQNSPDGNITPLFVLKNSVKIKSSKWFSKAVKDATPELNNLVSREINKELK